MIVMPLVMSVGISVVAFERAISTFERTENQMLEELFSLEQLEILLGEAENLAQEDWGQDSLAIDQRFERLSQEVEKTFAVIENKPSQLREKRSLLEWH